MLVEDARGAYGRGILHSRSHNCLIGSHECPLLVPHPVVVSAFIICSGLCACTEMLGMCVLYVSFESKVRASTFGCVAMGSAVMFILRSRLLLYSAWFGVNKVQVALSRFTVSLFCVVHAKTVCMYGYMYFLAALVLASVDGMVMSSAYAMT